MWGAGELSRERNEYDLNACEQILTVFLCFRGLRPARRVQCRARSAIAAAQRATHDRRARYALAVSQVRQLPGKEQEEEEDRETGRIFEDGNEKKADDSGAR